MMKFKVYEVKTIQFDGITDYEHSFLYADYQDAVKGFKGLVKEAEKTNWVQRALNSGNDKYILKNNINYWSFHIDEVLDYKSYEVLIEEREVF